MSIYSNLLALDCTPTNTLTNIGIRARLPLTIAGLLLTAQAQAFLPTPAALVMTGELALDGNEAIDGNLVTKSQNAEPILTTSAKPVVAGTNVVVKVNAESNNTIKASNAPNIELASSASNTKNINDADTEQLLA